MGPAQRFAHIAHGTARSVGDHGGGQCGALAAVALVDILNHFFAALVLKVHIDIWGFVALGGDKALK